MKLKNGVLVLCLLVFNGCGPSPKPIEFGFDSCHYCKMTIVDTRHAAEFVTAKGKAFKFDAIECMLQEMQQTPDDNEIALTLVCTMDKPGELLPAGQSTYLISEAIPSPMGANLSAFSDEKKAQSASTIENDQIMDWKALNETFKNGAIRFSGH